MPNYNPPRQRTPKKSDDPLEVALVYNVRPCGTCDFFWPEDTSKQPYGPFPIFDFESNTPASTTPKDQPKAYPWLPIVTQPQSFPNGEIMDGCRKVPIMTIGINPNLTAFSPGVTGTSWAYPGFTSDGDTDEWIKYAYYYRYRTVYQERFQFDTLTDPEKGYLVPGSEIKAEKDGEIVSADRPSDSPSFDLVVRYDGDDKDTTIPLNRKLGEPRYVLLFNRDGDGSKFKAGQPIAAKLDVPGGKKLELWQEQIGYYEQFVPTLKLFNDFLHKEGHRDADVRIGEDVGQLDMVACASPHWKPDFLGGTPASERTVIDNCVHENAWAMKQFVQTKPAILFLVGESSYSMFRDSFGALIKRDPPLSAHPSDGAFTLFSETIDPKRPCTFEFSGKIDGREYSINTRLVVTPHFSYDTNFAPQFRLSKKWLEELEKNDPACAKFLKTDKRITYDPAKWGDNAFLIEGDPKTLLAEIDKDYPKSAKELNYCYYNPHEQMYAVLEELYKQGQLSYQDGSDGKSGYLTRTTGSCNFCVNDHWTFPLGCPYGKNEETPPPSGFLDAVAAAIVKAGSPD